MNDVIMVPMKYPKVSQNQYKEYIRLLQNPYAKESIEPPIDAEISQYVKNTENPYASLTELYVSGDDDRIQKIQGIKLPGRATKLEFKKECRRIFLQYIPEEERRQIRSPHTDFIQRNEDRASEERYELIAALQRYDLSKHTNYQMHFNRESEKDLEAMLKKVEKILKK